MQLLRCSSGGIFLFALINLTIHVAGQTLAIISVGGGQIIATSINELGGSAVIIVNNVAFPVVIINGQPVVIINGQVIGITVAQFVGSGSRAVVSSQEIAAFTTIRSGTGTKVTDLNVIVLTVACDVDAAGDSTVVNFPTGHCC